MHCPKVRWGLSASPLLWCDSTMNSTTASLRRVWCSHLKLCVCCSSNTPHYFHMPFQWFLPYIVAYQSTLDDFYISCFVDLVFSFSEMIQKVSKESKDSILLIEVRDIVKWTDIQGAKLIQYTHSFSISPRIFSSFLFCC